MLLSFFANEGIVRDISLSGPKQRTQKHISHDRNFLIET